MFNKIRYYIITTCCIPILILIFIATLFLKNIYINSQKENLEQILNLVILDNSIKLDLNNLNNYKFNNIDFKFISANNLEKLNIDEYKNNNKDIYFLNKYNDNYKLSVGIYYKNGILLATETINNKYMLFISNLKYIGPLIFILIIIIILLSKKCTQLIMSNLYDTTKDLSKEIDSLSTKDISKLYLYDNIDEFKPIIDKFEFILIKQKKYMNKLKIKQEELERIIDNMQEGLLVLDDNYNILLSNREGLKTFNIKKLKKNKSFLHLYRDEEFTKMLKKSKENNIIMNIDKSSGDVFRIHINYSSNIGYTILTQDVTQIVNLEKQRDNFNANLSHELKTPITSIFGFSELLVNDMVKEPEKVKEYHKNIYFSSKRMIELISDILKLYEIENNSINDVIDIDIKNTILSIITMLKYKIDSKNIKVFLDGNATYSMNYDHAIELFTNLIDNAIKYNIENGNININIYETKENVIVSISDTGIGIPNQELDKIFDRFYRVDKSRNNKIPGTGLGLSIVKQILEIYSSRVEVENYNKGSKFIIYLNKLL